MSHDLDQLGKIDVVIDRTGLSFADARQVLEDSHWDLFQALEVLEREEGIFADKDQYKDNKAFNFLKRAMQEGSSRKISVTSHDERTIAELPIAAGVVTAALAPKLMLIGVAACLLTRCTVQFDKVDN